MPSNQSAHVQMSWRSHGGNCLKNDPTLVYILHSLVPTPRAMPTGSEMPVNRGLLLSCSHLQGFKERPTLCHLPQESVVLGQMAVVCVFVAELAPHVLCPIHQSQICHLHRDK